MLSLEFLTAFKASTEQKWSRHSILPGVWGFRIQHDTRWIAGLSDDKINEYERTLGLRFPNDFRAFLRFVNGTDLPTLNVYGSSGEPERESVGVYSYPRDLEFVQDRIENLRDNRDEIATDLRSQGFELPAEAGFVPIYSHRYLVCASDPGSSVVLSVVTHSVDAIVYGNSLREYLEREFLRDL